MVSDPYQRVMSLQVELVEGGSLAFSFENSQIISNHHDFVEECLCSCFRPVLDDEVGRGSPQES